MEVILSLLSQGAYYFGIGSGFLISVVILAPLLNTLLTHLTFKYEISTFGNVINTPILTKDQKDLLKKTLYWWNKQCDSWYMTSDKSVDKILSGQKVNLIDLERISDATQAGKIHGKHRPSDDTQFLFDALQRSIIPVEKKLRQEVEYKKLNNNLVKEADILGRQLKIARYSAIAAIASTIATILLTYIAYLDIISR